MRTLEWLLLGCLVLNAETVREVGPDKRYKKPCGAIGAAHSGDTIAIDAGEYQGDSCIVSQNKLTIKGVNGRAVVHAPEFLAEGKAMWVVRGNDTTFENIESDGAHNPSRNGAPIRLEGRNLTLRNVYFHDNQDGLLTNKDGIGDVLIEYSEFAHNGFGEGLSHNMYINQAESFTLRYSYSHDANVGHLVKSRAKVNYILYNRLIDGPQGQGSYEIDLPSGGTSYIVGNVIDKGPMSQNSAMICYREEANLPRQAPFMNPSDDLYVINNTMTSTLVDFVQLANIDWKQRPAFVVRTPDMNPEKKPYPMSTRFIQIDPSVKTPALIQNNVFVAKSLKDITGQPSAKQVTNVVNDDSRSKKGTPPGKSAGGFDLTPVFQWVEGKVVPRTDATDVGAVQGLGNER